MSAQDVYARREEVLSLLSSAAPWVARELKCALSNKLCCLEEIHLRAPGLSSYRIGGRDYTLTSRMDKDSIARLIDIATEGATYAYADSLKEGYVSLKGGIRVGVVMGHGLFDVRALVFRFQVSVIGMGGQLYRQLGMLNKGGVLIVSRPGGGKTTALRALAMQIGCGNNARRVAVVDTRGEFLLEDYSCCTVDIYSGIERSQGIEAALRYTSPEVIMCDEIFTESDADALAAATGAGVTVIATAHGTSLVDVRKRGYLHRLLDLGVFTSVVSIERLGEEFRYTVEGVEGENGGNSSYTFSLPFGR